MRRLDKEINDPEVLNEILNKSQVVRLAFSIDDVPHIVPLSFGYAGGNLYIHSATEGSKIDFIQRNNLVCFEMELFSEIVKGERACDWTTRYRSIVGRGRISIVSDPGEKVAGLNIIMEKYGGGKTHDYNTGLLEEMVLLVVNIDHLTGKQSGEWA